MMATPIRVFTIDFPSKINNDKSIEDTTPNICPPKRRTPDAAASPTGKAV
jgi:hypothetical protein